jgi:hypothetical protein
MAGDFDGALAYCDAADDIRAGTPQVMAERLVVDFFRLDYKAGYDRAAAFADVYIPREGEFAASVGKNVADRIASVVRRRKERRLKIAEIERSFRAVALKNFHIARFDVPERAAFLHFVPSSDAGVDREIVLA